MRHTISFLSALLLTSFTALRGEEILVRDAASLRSALEGLKSGTTLKISPGDYPGGHSVSGIEKQQEFSDLNYCRQFATRREKVVNLKFLSVLCQMSPELLIDKIQVCTAKAFLIYPVLRIYLPSWGGKCFCSEGEVRFSTRQLVKGHSSYMNNCQFDLLPSH